MPITILSLLLDWFGALCSRPPVLEHTPIDHVLDLVSWLLLPAVAELICYLRELPGWPHLFET
ncbi:MAG: hypothetical protein U0903_22225 [Planctomycetales bacterium]